MAPLLRWDSAPTYDRADAFHEQGVIGLGGGFYPHEIEYEQPPCQHSVRWPQKHLCYRY